MKLKDLLEAEAKIRRTTSVNLYVATSEMLKTMKERFPYSYGDGATLPYARLFDIRVIDGGSEEECKALATILNSRGENVRVLTLTEETK